MSTQYTDLDKGQEASRGTAGTIYNEDTIHLEQAPPPVNVPQPPQKPPHSKRNFWFTIAAVVIILGLIFSVFAVFISQPGKQPGTQITTTATAPSTTSTTTPGSDVTPSPAPGVTNGPQNGPSGVNTAAYWDTILGTKDTNGKVESVSFANVMGNPTLQALVTVRHSDANNTLDVYVFDKITSKNPVKIFTLDGLIKGQAKISYYNSIMTAEVNPNSTLNAGKSVSQMTPNLFREFAWINGTMTQVAFPGIFPDMTRYQAEVDQANVSIRGYDPWKNDAALVAKALEVKFFKWQRTVTTKVLSGGGPNDVYATVQVQEAPIQNAQPTIVVTLSRLEGNTHNMWVAIGVQDSKTLTLTNITARQSISSPVTLKGTGAAFESQIGQAVIYDQAYANIGHATVHANMGAGTGAYSTQVSYTSSFNGVQEGMVSVYQDMGGLSAENGTAVMVKVLVNPTTASIQNPAYWTQFVSAPPAIRVADSVTFGHLLGKPSLQAVVVGRDILGGGPVYSDVFVFDNINASQPQLLWHESSLLHGGAKISTYNTVMTAQVDVNSSINKGKMEGALTTDLFREFNWSNSSGTFVQVAFPGIFPDLTRYQAEADQTQVNAGQDSWKNDPALVAKALAVQFLNWQGTVTTKVLSGGGAQDVNASVQVQGTPIQNAQPTIVVTLSRLEGNTHNMWVATAVQDSTRLTLTNIPAGSLISSPVTLTGTGSAFEALIGQGVVYDHLYTTIGHAQIVGSPGMGEANYSIKVPYTSSFKGAQEGIVAAYQDMGGLSSGNYSAVMVKVLIGG